MSAPTELSFDEILKFMLAHNGKVTNHELVKHFKVFLMNPDMRDEARSTFKKHVNTLAIIKNQNNEKWLILKKKYHMTNNGKENEEAGDSKMPDSPSVTTPENTNVQPPYRPPPPLQLNQDFSVLNNIIQDTSSPVTSSPTEISHSESKESLSLSTSDDVPPKVYPRKKSMDKSNEKRSSITNLQGHRTSIPNQDTSLDETMSSTLTSSRSESMLIDNEQKISVKERKQMFNRMASESDVLKSNKMGTFTEDEQTIKLHNFLYGTNIEIAKKNQLSQLAKSVDEEDRVSLDHKGEPDPLDSKQKQWIMCAARGEYHALAKMCKENAKLVKTKTAMHWACKRGDENLVKLLAGVARHVVNERSKLMKALTCSWIHFKNLVLVVSRGYTPLHIAMQFRHENVYRLLVDVYDADPNARDWSGRKPRQYLVHMDTSLSPGSYRKKEGFLRIGSLNVRVKKTTEAFSNFLGVGATRSSAYVPKSRGRDLERRSDDVDQLHKSWGSADNIQKDDKLMPPPMSGKVKRRGASGRRGLAAHSRSTPSTPDQPRAQMGLSEEGDSDSDSAAGFHSAWRQQRSSCT